MKKIIVDTNVLISFLTDRNFDQQKKATSLFTSAANLKNELIFQQEVISEFVYVMQSVYKTDRDSINSILQDLIEMPGVVITSNLNFETVLALWPKHISDYGDAVIAASCKIIRNSAIATFDQEFIKQLSDLDFATTHYFE